MLVPGKSFHVTLMFTSWIGAYLSDPLLGKLLTLATIFRLGWKALPRKNTLAFRNVNYGDESLITMGHGLMSVLQKKNCRTIFDTVQ